MQILKYLIKKKGALVSKEELFTINRIMYFFDAKTGIYGLDLPSKWGKTGGDKWGRLI